MPDLEDIFELLAVTLDKAGPDRARLVLAKIALSLVAALDDPEKARAIIENAAQPDPGCRH